MKNNLGTIGNYKWFIAQVATDQNEAVKEGTWDDTHGDRVKIRIPGKHPKTNDTLSDDDLPWAIVAKPTLHGNRNYVSSGIWGGEWVIGFFMDEGEQQPVITHVLGNNQSEYETNKSNMMKRVNRYNSGMKPGKHQLTTGSKPSGQTEINNEDFLNMEVQVPTTDRDIIPTPYIDESAGTTVNLNPSL
tara:strand:- start:1417 stop:1980 length:564 start_codon:yes stop_codon:yes gene_type:complete